MNLKELIEYNFTMAQTLREKINVLEKQAGEPSATNSEISAVHSLKVVQKILDDMLPADTSHWNENHEGLLFARYGLIKETLGFIDDLGLPQLRSLSSTQPPIATLVQMLQFRKQRTQDTRVEDSDLTNTKESEQ